MVESKVVRIHLDVYKRLKAKAVGFETVSDAIERLLDELEELNK